MRRIGVHTSIADGLDRSLERAHALGCTAVQIFSHNPRGWAVKDRGADELRRFRQARAALGISPVVIHTSYLINLASPLPALARRSVDMLVQEMHIADSLDAEYVVVHTGSASGDDPAEARNRAIRRLQETAGRGRWRAGLLLENTAGERGDITSGFGEMAGIMQAVGGELIAGICFDTCHAFAAGYDIGSAQGLEKTAREIESLIGKEQVRVIHFNDSKGALGSRKDRHEHIGQGAIGTAGLRLVLNLPLFSGIPVILETPKTTEDDDLQNLARVRELQEMQPAHKH